MVTILAMIWKLSADLILVCLMGEIKFGKFIWLRQNDKSIVLHKRRKSGVKSDMR